jgi:[acyl-carrier-protein] S-malonyltransferase
VAGRKLFCIFPGQGSQYRGMGSDLVAEFPAAREIYARASEIVDYDMQVLSFEDPREELNQTRFTQPALLTHQIACLEALKSWLSVPFVPLVAAGHSLGEYAALVCAGALSFDAALALVKERGRLMSELGRGSMLATTLDLESAQALADKHYCGIGGANLPEQTVVAGDDADLDRLEADLGATYPGKRAVRLNTGGAFHTYHMVGAALQFRALLEATEFGPLGAAVLSNYTGKLHADDAGSIRSGLFFQLFNPVRWVDCLTAAFDAGADAVLELGGGIGKGESPDSKRPNLESIVKKFLKWRGLEAEYLPAINVAGIRAAAERAFEEN